jgi:hypothetical protein
MKKQKILLLGENSRLHWTLAQGLRKQGHKVCVVANKGKWRNYSCDVNLTRHSTHFWDTLYYALKLLWYLPQWRGYDIVQINSSAYFLDLKSKLLYSIFKYLKKNNKKIFLGAFGNDYYYIKASYEDRIYRYCDFYTSKREITHQENMDAIQEWLKSNEHAPYNQRIAQECNGIACCLYEYYAAYQAYFKTKIAYLPLPINVNEITSRTPIKDGKIHFFIGIQAERTALKGTDILYTALQRIQAKYPDKCSIEKAECIPYAVYQQMMNQSDVLLDQIYSYTPAMNALLAMAKGIVVVSGGEKEHYHLLNEQTLRPIVNVLPEEDEIYNQLEQLVLHPEELTQRSEQSIAYIKKHHHYEKVALKYLDFWNNH